MQKLQASSSIKLKINYDENRLNVTKFISNIVGNLQCLEFNILQSLDKSEQVLDYSIKNIIKQLNCYIDVSIYHMHINYRKLCLIFIKFKALQVKLNTVDLLLSNNKHSSSLLNDTISDIEQMLNRSYFIAKKNKSKPKLFFNSQVFSTIHQCINAKIDFSNIYIFGFLPQVPFGYVLTSKIEMENNGKQLFFIFPICDHSKYLKNYVCFFLFIYIISITR